MSGSMSPVPDDTPAKRKLRKGTSSCRECKRRKTRCLFLSQNDSICIGCQKRGSICQSQEFGDDAETIEEINMRGRLIRVEHLLGKLMQKVMPEGAEENDESDVTGIFRKDNAIPAVSPQVPSTRSSAFKIASAIPKVPEKYEDMCRILHAALPSQEASDVLVGNGRSSIYLQVLANPYDAIVPEEMQDPLILARLPSVSSHPALIARKLLQIAACIQQLDPSFDLDPLHLNAPPHKVVAQYLELTSSLVLTNDRLIDSLEGMECLILEAVCLINSGNLRRAWFCFRRAMSLAQFMGIHRGTPKNLKVLDPSTQASCSIIWFRICYGERYISLLLGAPSAVVDNSFACEENMMDATPTDRIDRVHAVVSGLIIERNETNTYRELATTQKIDFDLQAAAKTVPAKWWLLPVIHAEMELTDMMLDVIRGQTQIIHYNLLTVLHLPYMLRNSPERRYDYSKLTCIYASREVLSRFIHFRAMVRVVYCCRFVDFCAFTAALALLLGHLDNHRNNVGDILTHQRLSDRALVEKALGTLDELNRVNNDTLSKQTADVTRKLLAIEADACDASNIYSMESVAGDEADAERDYSFRLKIPHFGTISIAREPLQRAQPPAYPSVSATNYSSSPSLPPSTPMSSSLNSAPRQSNHSYVDATQVGLMWPQSTSQMQHEQMAGVTQPFLSFEADYMDENMAMPDFIAEAEDWAFQGVDATFFDVLMKGDAANGINWDLNWTNWEDLR